MTEDILDRNATCPICGKYYHNIDIYNNPIPSRENKRKEDELCQCAKGKAARTLRREQRLQYELDLERRKARKEDILSMHERNRAYWRRIAQGGDSG